MSARPVGQAWIVDQLREIEMQRAQAVRNEHGDIQHDSERGALGRYLQARETLYKRVARERKARLHALHPDKLRRAQSALELAEYAWLAALTDKPARPVLSASARRKPNMKQAAADAYRTALVEHYRTLAPPPRPRLFTMIPDAEARTPTAPPGSRAPNAQSYAGPVQTPNARKDKDRLRKRAARAKARAVVVQPTVCAVCGAPLQAQRHGRRRYCSGACRAKASRIGARP